MGRPFIASLEGNVYCCNICAAHLAIQGDLLSKSFHSRSGKAFLFNAVSNCIEGRIEERVMTTGFHLVCDLHCNTCNNLLGWKYEEAEEESQKYKVGKSILEAAKLKSSFVSAPPRDWSSFSASLLHIEAPDDK